MRSIGGESECHLDRIRYDFRHAQGSEAKLRRGYDVFGVHIRESRTPEAFGQLPDETIGIQEHHLA